MGPESLVRKALEQDMSAIDSRSGVLPERSMAEGKAAFTPAQASLSSGPPKTRAAPPYSSVSPFNTEANLSAGHLFEGP